VIPFCEQFSVSQVALIFFIINFLLLLMGWLGLLSNGKHVMFLSYQKQKRKE
jgi:hypothetical protein